MSYEGPIEPGMEFIWEPTNPAAFVVIVVVKYEHDFEHARGRVWYHATSGPDRHVELWSDEGRFREAVSPSFVVQTDPVTGMGVAVGVFRARPSATGAELIAAERRRQVDVEGWTPEHDDSHDVGELSDAAASYLEYAFGQIVRLTPGSQWGTQPKSEPEMWPWSSEYWKPNDDPIRNLVKAGALIAAEIDRLQRVRAKAPAAAP